MLRKFWKDESGQGMVEYVLIVALVAIIVIAGVKLFGSKIKEAFSSQAQTVSNETKNP